MKSLTQFIKESQEIHESLFGDIVRKLLDTGLSWIEGSVKWIANKSTDAVGEIWKTHRDILGTTYSDFRRTYPQYHTKSTNHIQRSICYKQSPNNSRDSKYSSSSHCRSLPVDIQLDRINIVCPLGQQSGLLVHL